MSCVSHWVKAGKSGKEDLLKKESQLHDFWERCHIWWQGWQKQTLTHFNDKTNHWGIRSPMNNLNYHFEIKQEWSCEESTELCLLSHHLVQNKSEVVLHRLETMLDFLDCYSVCLTNRRKIIRVCARTVRRHAEWLIWCKSNPPKDWKTLCHWSCKNNKGLRIGDALQISPVYVKTCELRHIWRSKEDKSTDPQVHIKVEHESIFRHGWGVWFINENSAFCVFVNRS